MHGARCQHISAANISFENRAGNISFVGLPNQILDFVVAIVPKVPTLRQQMSAEVTDLTARDMCNTEQEKVEDGTDVEREAVERKVVNVNRISIELINVDSGSGTRSNITEGSDISCSDDDLEMRTFER